MYRYSDFISLTIRWYCNRYQKMWKWLCNIQMGRGWKFWRCIHISVNGPLWINLARFQKKMESCTENLNLLMEYINNPEQNVGRNMDGYDYSDDVLGGNKKHMIRWWKEHHLCYELEKILVELCLYPSVLWKVELMSNKNEYFAKEISKLSVNRTLSSSWWLVVKCQER